MPMKFNFVKKGYDPAEVDKYIEELEGVVGSYKEKDASIKNAILSAQVAGDAIVGEAKQKAEEIISGAVQKVNDITELVVGQKKIIDDFRSEYDGLARKYIHTVNDQEFNAIYSKIGELEQYYGDISRKAAAPDENGAGE